MLLAAAAARPHLPALLALQEPDALPRDRAVVHRPRQARACAPHARGDRARRPVDPAVGRGSHLQHGRAPPDWCISRQRVWGVPIVAFYCAGCETLLLEERIVEHVATIFRQGRGRRRVVRARGARAAARAARAARSAAATSFRKETRHPRRVVRLRLQPRGGARDAPRAALAGRALPRRLGPAPRLVPVLAARRRSARATRRPTRACVTHGFVVDGEGRKMSKSLGNVITLDELLPKYGAEILRLWVAAEDYRDDIRVSKEILDRLADAYRRMRNTFRFLLGNLGDFDPARDRQSYARLDEVDRWVARPPGAPDRPRPARPTTSTSSTPSSTACTTSARSISRRSTSTSSRTGSTPRCPTTRGGARRRRRASTSSARWRDSWRRSSTFTCEEAWRHMPGAHSESVHLERFPEAPREWLDDTLKRDWDRLLEVRREVAKALETARAGKLIGSGLEACGAHRERPRGPAGAPARQARAPADGLHRVARGARALRRRARASRTRARTSPGWSSASTARRGEKCERCWTRSEHVGESREHPTLCERCVPIVARLSGSGDPR